MLASTSVVAGRSQAIVPAGRMVPTVRAASARVLPEASILVKDGVPVGVACAMVKVTDLVP